MIGACVWHGVFLMLFVMHLGWFHVFCHFFLCMNKKGPTSNVMSNRVFPKSCIYTSMRTYWAKEG